MITWLSDFVMVKWIFDVDAVAVNLFLPFNLSLRLGTVALLGGDTVLIQRTFLGDYRTGG